MQTLPPFYVGQEVVAIRNHSAGFYHKGQTYTVTSIFMGCCGWQITIGTSSAGYQKSKCNRCGKADKLGEFAVFFADGFSAIEKFKAVTYSRIIEEIPVSVN